MLRAESSGLQDPPEVLEMRAFYVGELDSVRNPFGLARAFAMVLPPDDPSHRFEDLGPKKAHPEFIALSGAQIAVRHDAGADFGDVANHPIIYGQVLFDKSNRHRCGRNETPSTPGQVFAVHVASPRVAEPFVPASERTTNRFIEAVVRDGTAR
jgi:hypothetical protein